MIGRWLLTLTPEQEDRLLESKLQSRAFVRDDGSRCLIGAVRDYRRACDVKGPFPRLEARSGMRYDLLCQRWGEITINAAIRNRILSNRARRAKQDGFCALHHPDAVKARRELSQKRFEEKYAEQERARQEFKREIVREFLKAHAASELLPYVDAWDPGL